MEASDDTTQTSDKRKKVQRLRKCNVRLLVISVVMLIVLCAMLLVRIYDLNNTIAGMSAQIEELTIIAAQQEAQLVRLAEEMAAMEESENDRKREEPPEDKTDLEQAGQNEDDENDTQVSSPEVTAAHKVYLTFDDGPSLKTPKILDILDEYGVKATFFAVGKESDSAKDSLKRIVEDGHTLGMHSWSHKYSAVYESMDSFVEDFTKLQDYLYDVTGVRSVFYRFPGGSSNTVSKIDMAEFAQYLDSQGVCFFDWNLAAGDGTSKVPSADVILENCTANIERYGTAVILMHEKDATIEALPKIIETIQAMEDTVILPITEDTKPIQHIKWQEEEESAE